MSDRSGISDVTSNAEPFDAFVRRVAPEHAVLILFEYDRLREKHDEYVQLANAKVLALENAGMETAAQLGEEQQLREEAEQSIDYYQHELAKLRRDAVDPQELVNVTMERDMLRDKNQRDVQRIGDMDAGIERLLAREAQAAFLFGALGHGGEHDDCDPCAFVRASENT